MDLLKNNADKPFISKITKDVVNEFINLRNTFINSASNTSIISEEALLNFINEMNVVISTLDIIITMNNLHLSAFSFFKNVLTNKYTTIANKINALAVYISLQYCNNQTEFLERLSNFFTPENYNFWIDTKIDKVYNIKTDLHFINSTNLELKLSNELDNIKNDFDMHSNLTNNQDRLKTILDFLNHDIFERFINVTEGKVKLYNRTAILKHYHKSKMERKGDFI